MRLAWPVDLDDPDPEVRLRRTRFALETVIGRIRPATFAYPLLLVGYLVLTIVDSGSAVPPLIAVAAQLVISFARVTLYRRSIAARAADPDRWRKIIATFSAMVMIVWDSFLVFEVWRHRFDALSMLLVTASLVLRATGTFTTSPDLYFHRMWSRWSRLPIVFAPFVLPTFDGLILAAAFASHLVYSEIQARQLASEFWRRVIATDSLEAAHATLRREVAMRERAEIELRLAQKLESVGRLAAGIAHEINTPLQAIMSNHAFLEEGIADLVRIAHTYEAALPDDARDPELAEELAFLADKLPESSQLANAQLDRTADIVRSVRAFAGADAADTLAPRDVNEALVTTLTMARHEYADVADLVTELGELPRVDAVIGELGQAFLQLIVNAAQAIAPVQRTTGQRGILRVATSTADGWVVIAISDTGVGVPDTIRERIFDPFFTTKDVGLGTGQGLAVARSVVARHGGELTFTSEVGRGTTFTMRLPIARVLRSAA